MKVRPTESYIDESRARILLEKWAPVLDYSSDTVAPIEDDHRRLSTAVLLENQEQWCNESNTAGGTGGVFGYGGSPVNAGNTGGRVGNSDSYASGDARLPKILIPMIRRTFPELITNEIVGVQPMGGPVGLAFALRYKYLGDSLGSQVNDGDGAPNVNGPRGGVQSAANGKELGYQYLNTGFTGVSSGALSGANIDNLFK